MLAPDVSVDRLAQVCAMLPVKLSSGMLQQMLVLQHMLGSCMLLCGATSEFVCHHDEMLPWAYCRDPQMLLFDFVGACSRRTDHSD